MYYYSVCQRVKTKKKAFPILGISSTYTPLRQQPLQRHSSSPCHILKTTPMTKNENGHTTLQFFISPNFILILLHLTTLWIECIAAKSVVTVRIS
jgi:hypothetical protein